MCPARAILGAGGKNMASLPSAGAFAIVPCNDIDAALPFWDQLRARPGTQAALRGANASVVGILAAALYDPVWTSAVMRPSHAVIAVTGFLVLTFWRVPAWTVVIGVVGLTALFASVT